MSERTLVLNSSYQVVGIISWQRAVTLLYENCAEILHEWDNKINELIPISYDREVSNHNRKYVYKLPAIIRLINSNVLPKHKNVKFSKINVFYRDNFECCYCGYKGENNSSIKSRKMTIDHVVPVSKGGKTSFENCVTACYDCNTEKGNKFLSDTNLKLRKKPIVPSISILLKRKMNRRNIHKSWEKYLHDSPIMI